MNDTLIQDHYQAGISDSDDLMQQIARLVDMQPKPLTASALAALDQFHVGGLAATEDLARRAGVQAEATALDAGSGLGGPSRYLAETYGSSVVGVDLSPAYVDIARFLAKSAGHDDLVSYRVGDLAALDFDDGFFDLIWTQHVAMNVADREGLYREFRRVLKGGGKLAFYDPILGEGAKPPMYPVPWATSQHTSTLLTRAQTLATMERAGFEVLSCDDVTELATSWQTRTVGSTPGLGLVVGPRMAEIVENFVRNLREGRLRLAMGVCRAR